MRQERDSGFTLVELMVVVLILGILIMIALPTFSTVRAMAQERTCWANMRTVDGANMVYMTRFEATIPFTDWPSLMAALVGAHILDEPQCPGAGQYSWDGIDVRCTRHGKHP